MWGRFPEGGNGTRKKNSIAKSPGLLPRLATWVAAPGRCAHHIYDIRAYIFRLSCLDGHTVRH